MNNLYAGTISEKRDLARYNDDGDSVINLVVETSKTIVGNIKVAVKRTVVLFRGEAEKADNGLSVGDNVVFSDAVRSPRIFKTTRGKTVEAVDIIAGGFTVVPPREFKSNMEALAKLSLTEEELTFTDVDRAALEAQATESAADDTDLDDII